LPLATSLFRLYNFTMIVVEKRHNWRFDHQLTLYKRPKSEATSRGLLIVGGGTAVYLIWLLYRWILQPEWIGNLPQLLIDLMQTTQLAAGFTIAVLWAAIYWRQHRVEPPLPQPKMTIDQLYALSPAEFEAYVGQLFAQKGYRVNLRGRTGDLGVDVELRNRKGKRAIVQCKRYRSTVGAEIVRELYGTMIHERVAHAFLVTTAEISKAAQSWAKGKPITLIDGQTLVEIASALSKHPQV